MSRVEETVKNIIANTLGVSINEVEEDTAIGDIPSWDSLNHLQIIARLEKEFGIRFTPDVMMELEDVSDIVKAVEDRVK